MAAVEGVSGEASAAPGGALCEAFAAALARGRGEYNARVEAARQAAPSLEAGALASVLRDLDPVVAAAHARDAKAVDGVVSALLDAAVELVGKGVVGPAARHPELAVAWRTLLAGAAPMLCASPRHVVAAAMNGLTRLVACPGARAGDWVRTMTALAAHAQDVDAWLDAGLVASWRAGIAHARAAALSACERLPPALASVALDLAPLDAATMAGVLGELRAAPWSWPPRAVSGAPATGPLAYVFLVGGFRGFGTGGRFVTPPRVGMRDGVFVATDGETAFEVYADFFGATVVPLGPAFEPPEGHGPLAVQAGGAVVYGGRSTTFPQLAQVTSWASNEHTLLAATAISHRLVVVARAGEGWVG